MSKVNILTVSLLIVCAGLMQATAFDYIGLLGTKPDLLLVIVIFFSLSSARPLAVKAAIAAGLIKDITSSSILGSYTLSFLLIAVFLNYHQRKFYSERGTTQIPVGFFSSFLVSLLVLLLNIIAEQRLAPYPPFLNPAFIGAAYTGLISPPIFFLLSKALRVPLAPRL